MKRTFVLLTVALAILSLTGPVLAQGQTAPPTSASPPTGATPAQPAKPSASKPATGVKHMTGEVVSVNADNKSLTVKHTGKKKPKELTFTLTGDAAGHLGDFNPGDSVRVAYVDEAGKLVVQSVTHSKHAAKK